MKIEEMVLSSDHKSILINGVWCELTDTIEKIAYIKDACISCPKEKFEHCLQFQSVVDRKAHCEMLGEVKLFENMSTNPMPQVGKMYEDFLAKKVTKPVEVVNTEPKPEPPKKGFIEQVKASLKAW